MVCQFDFLEHHFWGTEKKSRKKVSGKKVSRKKSQGKKSLGAKKVQKTYEIFNLEHLK